MTAQTKAALTTAFADNTSGAISPQDSRDIIDSTLGCYGGLYLGSGPASGVFISSTPGRITGFNTAMPADSVTVDVGDDTLSPTVAGDYHVEAWLSFDGDAGRTYTIELFVNAATTGIKAQAGYAAAGRIHVRVSGILTLTAGQVVDARIAADQSVIWTLQDGAFVLRRLG